MTYEQYLESQGVFYIPSNGEDSGHYAIRRPNADGGFDTNAIGYNDEGLMDGYNDLQRQQAQVAPAPTPAPTPAPPPPAPEPAGLAAINPSPPAPKSIEEYLQQQGFVYRPDTRGFDGEGPSGNYGAYGKYRTEGGAETPEVQVFNEIYRDEVAKYYEDPSRFKATRDTGFGQGLNTFNEGNENQKRILDQINTGQLYISPRLVAGRVAGEPEAGGEGYREEKVYDLRDSRTGEPVQQYVKAIDAEKGIFNIVADDPNSSGFFNNYVSTDTKGFVNPIASEEQSQYASRPNSSANFYRNIAGGLLSMSGLAFPGLGQAIGAATGLGNVGGNIALNTGINAIKQGITGNFDPLSLATSAALSYLGAGGTDAATLDDLYAGQAMTDMANSGGIYNPIAAQANLDATYTPDSQYINQDAQGYDKIKFKDDPYRYLASRGIEGKDYLTNKATGAIDYLSNTNPLDYPGDLYDVAEDYYDKSSPTKLALTAAGLYSLSNLGGGAEQPKSQAQIDAEEEANRVYTYGTSTSSGSNFIPKNRINASNVYTAAAGYRPLNRYADGGEVQHYGIGGKISDAFTRVAQPFEKAILRPIGEAAPFLKDMAPYAGMAAGAMFGNPAMAAGIGGLASGFGKPGGFDMKRALMGGIAAYGMSNLVGGLEAAGTEPTFMGSIEDPLSSGIPLPPANQTFRSPEAVQKGIGNLLQNSNTPEYKNAMSTFTKNAGIYNAGVPLIMGTTGMMGVDEGNELKKEYDRSLMAQQAEEANFNARVLAGKKRAQQAVSENPYRFAMGGAIDDEYGGDDMNMVNGNMQNGFMGYAEGGVPRFLSGGGDGMSDSIKAKIEGTQEARLADGEFVIPADVVSHLGNGSSKAGAKQLYAMMDRVRKARTGNRKQGKQIKPTKFMPV